jgi:hypothetical protein
MRIASYREEDEAADLHIRGLCRLETHHYLLQGPQLSLRDGMQRHNSKVDYVGTSHRWLVASSMHGAREALLFEGMHASFSHQVISAAKKTRTRYHDSNHEPQLFSTWGSCLGVRSSCFS